MKTNGSILLLLILLVIPFLFLFGRCRLNCSTRNNYRALPGLKYMQEECVPPCPTGSKCVKVPYHGYTCTKKTCVPSCKEGEMCSFQPDNIHDPYGPGKYICIKRRYCGGPCTNAITWATSYSDCVGMCTFSCQPGCLEHCQDACKNKFS